MEILILISVIFLVGTTHSQVENTPYNLLMMKASHNSYERDESILEQLNWDPEENYQGGCRNIELDIWRHSNQWEGLFTVDHDSGNAGKNLSDYLNIFSAWHNSNPDHDVISVMLDIKSANGNYELFPGEIDWYLKKYFLDRKYLFTPGDILIDGMDLVESIQERKEWPSLGELKGKFMFILSGNETWKSYYAEQLTPCNLLFSDKEFSDNDTSLTPPESGNRIIFNFKLYAEHFSVWQNTIPPFRQANFLTRMYTANDETLWNLSKQAGINIIATDKIVNSTWAEVGGGYPFAPTPTLLVPPLACANCGENSRTVAV